MSLAALFPAVVGLMGLAAAPPPRVDPSRLQPPRFHASALDVTAYVLKGQVDGVENGAFTPLWIHGRLGLQAFCYAPLEKLELSGDKPFTPRTLKAGTAGGTSERFDLSVPLWSTAEALQGCAKGTAVLPRTVHAKLHCQGKPVVEEDIHLKLELRCEQSHPNAPSVMTLGVPAAFVVGATTPLTVFLHWGQLGPEPLETTLVEVDAEGKVLRRVASVPLPKDVSPLSQQTLQVPLDTTTARTARLALETRHADGSRGLSRIQTREIRSPEQQDAAQGRVRAFEKKLAEKFPDTCKDFSSAVKWLRLQPEVEPFPETRYYAMPFHYQLKGLPGSLMLCAQAMGRY
jgi:hypothetical protein